MPTGKRKIYWDTCIFLAWIKGENRAPGQLAGATLVADEIYKGTIVLLTSVITKAEISLLGDLNPGQLAQFNGVFGRRNVMQIDCSEKIAIKAAELRQHYRKTPASPGIGFADAIHLASAIVWKADVFHTFDGMRGPTVTKKVEELTLLPLSGNVAGYNLLIEVPTSPTGQGDLDLPPR